VVRISWIGPRAGWTHRSSSANRSGPVPRSGGRGGGPLSLEEDLRAETEKWLRRAEEARERASPRGEEGEGFSANIDAYLSDCRYFLDQGDLIRGFEAVIWAWAWIEIGERVGILVLEGNRP